MKRARYYLWIAVAMVPGGLILNSPSPWVALGWVWFIAGWATEMRIRAEIEETSGKPLE